MFWIPLEEWANENPSCSLSLQRVLRILATAVVDTEAFGQLWTLQIQRWWET
jgi:hypothetical protein